IRVVFDSSPPRRAVIFDDIVATSFIWSVNRCYSSKNYVRKFPRLIHPKWIPKDTTIDESKDLTSLSLVELIKNLKVHELIIKKNSETVKGKGERKSLVFLAKKEFNDEESYTYECEDEEYDMAVMTIEESKDLTSLSLDELIGNLKVYEMIIKKDSEIVKAKVKWKSIALKAKKESSDEECLTSGSEDERMFQRSRDDKNDKSDRKCFRCGDPNHLIGKCPKPPKDKNQRAFVGGSWSDSGEEDDEKVKDEMCIVAHASSETSPLVDDDLDEKEAIKVIEKKNLENYIVDETLEIDEIVSIKESRNHPLENAIRNLNQRTLRSQAQNKRTKWVFRSKLDENGIVSRYKARLVAQEYNQQEGIDYDETYALVARLESIRILLAYVCALDFKLFQMDIKSAFLNGFINKEVYAAQPLGFIDFEKLDHVYKLKKALYGLKQAPKACKKSLGRDSKGGIIILSPVSFEEHVAVQRETKARTLLLQSLPKDHMADFHHLDDAREIWLAVKARFSGNEESKKMRKTMLKQAFSEFIVSEEEGLHKGYDRFQKILSQLNQMQAKPDNDDVNIKFLRALPPSWSQVALTLKTRGGLEYLSFDDLYNKLRSFEIDVNGGSSYGSRSTTVAPTHSTFIGAASTNTKIVYFDQPSYSSSISYTPVPSGSIIEDVLHSFVAENEPTQQLAYEDFKQVDQLEMEELDIKWQMAMLSLRINKFQKKVGRKVNFNNKDSARFNRRKARCYNCLQLGHFAREYNVKKNEHDTKNKTEEAEQVYGLMVGFESDFAIPAGNATSGVNPAAIEFSMMGNSPKVQTCPLRCDSKLSKLKQNYDHLEKVYNDSFIQVQAYKNTVKTLEHQKDWYQSTQLALAEKVRILSTNLENTTNTLKYSETLYNQAKLEKKEWEINFLESLARFDKWKESSKNLAKLLYSSMSTRTKLGLGFKEFIGSDEVCDLSTPSVFDPEPDNREVKSLYERFVKAGKTHEVPPPITGTFMPTSYQSDLAETLGSFGLKSNTSSIPTSESNDFISCDNSDKSSVSKTYDFASCVSSPKTNDSLSTVDIKLLPNSDVKDPSLTNGLPSCSFKENVKPPRILCNKSGTTDRISCKNNFVRTKKCFVYGSKSHLIKDCHVYDTVDNFPSVVSKATSVLAASRNRLASIHADRSIPAASRNRSASIHAGRSIPVASRNRPASIYADRHIPAGRANKLAPFPAGRTVPTGGTVTFGGGDGKITGKGTIRTSKLDFENVYYVEELQNFNLFSVSQLCDKQNKVLFTDDECLVLSKEFQLPDESQGLVEGLPLKLFTNEHNCVACNKGKQHKASYKAISVVRTISKPLQLLHMDLFGPTFIRSIVHKYYSLVVTDDFRKANDDFLVGYAGHSKAYRVYNLSNKKVEEMLNLRYLEDKPNVQGLGQEWYFDLDYFTDSLGYTRFNTNPPAGPTVHDVSAPMENNLDYAEELARLQRQEYEAHSAAVKHGFDFSDDTSTLLHQDAIDTHRNLVLAAGDPAGSIVSTGGVPAGSVLASDVPASSLSASIISTGGVPASGVPAGSLPTSIVFVGGVPARSVPAHDVPVGSHSTSSVPVGGVHAGSIDTAEFGVPGASESVPAVFFNDPAATSPFPPGHSLGSCAHTTRFPSPSDLGNHLPTAGIFSSSSYDDDFCTDATNLASNVAVDLVSTKRIAIGTKWILKNKRDARGIMVRNKARLVAQGHRQEEGIDYDESAFLYEEIEEEVYVTQPKGFEDPHNPKHVYRVVKALYGLHQAPRAWISGTLFLFKFMWMTSSLAPQIKPGVMSLRSMIGSLMYLTASRPDIMFPVSACSRHQVTPLTSHLNAVKKIFKYLKGQPNLETVVATSFTKAEYVAAASCCGQLYYSYWSLLVRADDLVPAGSCIIPTVPAASEHVPTEPTVAVPTLSSSRQRRKHIAKKRVTPIVDMADAAMIKFDSDSDDDDDPLPYARYAGWEMVPSPLGSVHAYHDMAGHTKHFTTLRELLYLVEKTDLQKLLGAVDELYQKEEPDTFALLLTAGAFAADDYILVHKFMCWRRWMDGLEQTATGKDVSNLLIAVMVFQKPLGYFSSPMIHVPRAELSPFPTGFWLLLLLVAAGLVCLCCRNKDAILELTRTDLSRILKLTMSHSRLRKDCWELQN
nr:copia protein [Tanacetum cinerariifolium]